MNDLVSAATRNRLVASGDAVELATSAQGELSLADRRPSESVSFHDHIALDWDRKYAKKSFHSRQIAFEQCLPSRQLYGRWLDAGCGSGFLTRWIADKGASVESVDLAPKMLEIFSQHRERYGAKQRLLEPQLADVNLLPYASNTFDGIFCSSVLEYVDDPATPLREFRRVLVPGGWLAISVPNRVSLLRRGLEFTYAVTRLFGRPWPAYLQYSLHRFSIPEFQRLLNSCGFDSRGFAGCGTSLPGLKNTRLGWSLLVFGAIKKA